VASGKLQIEAAFFCLIAAAATACGAEVPQTPELYPRLAVSSALDEVAAVWLASYREEIGAPQFDLVPMPYPAAVEAAEAGEIELIIASAHPPPDWFVTPLTNEALVVIVHPDNAVLDLGLNELGRLYSGGIDNWKELGGRDLAVQPYLPYPGDDLRQVFEESVMAGQRLAGISFLVPHSRATREAVAGDPSGVGLIPGSMLDDSVRALRLEGVLPGPSTIADGTYPIRMQLIAIAPEEPAGAIREWLVWLQEPARLPEP
jgi:phosphate transport system substrate-binding protein